MNEILIHRITSAKHSQYQILYSKTFCVWMIFSMHTSISGCHEISFHRTIISINMNVSCFGCLSNSKAMKVRNKAKLFHALSCDPMIFFGRRVMSDFSISYLGTGQSLLDVLDFMMHKFAENISSHHVDKSLSSSHNLYRWQLSSNNFVPIRDFVITLKYDLNIHNLKYRSFHFHFQSLKYYPLTAIL